MCIIWLQMIQVLLKKSQNWSFFSFSFFFKGWILMGIIKQCTNPTHPDSPPPNPTHPHPHLSKIFSHPPQPLTQINKIFHAPKIMPHNVNFSNSLTKRRNNFSTIFQKNFSILWFFNYAQYLQISRIFGQI